MNESLGADPSEVLTARPQLPVPDVLEDIDYPPSESEAALTPRREGLPPGFRMRHDKHYVEELMSTPTIPGASPVASTRPSVPAGETVVDDRPAAPAAPPRPSAAAMELLAGRLEAVVAHDTIARSQAGRTDPVSRMVQGELERVTRFARALAVSARKAEPVRRSVTAGELAAALRSACARTARLHGMELQVTTDEAGFAVTAERALIVQGIAGTVDALLDLKQAGSTDDTLEDGGRITVSLQVAKPRPALIVDVECLTLAWRGSPDRFFQNHEQDFAGAPAAGILLESAAHVLRLHGGRAGAQLQGGVRVRYVFP